MNGSIETGFHCSISQNLSIYLVIVSWNVHLIQNTMICIQLKGCYSKDEIGGFNIDGC